VAMSLANRLRRLEALSHGGPCPCCLDWTRPVLLRDAEPEPECCLACGRRPFMVRIVRDPNFYQNRPRLDEVTT
jgi:hypothetical protein